MDWRNQVLEELIYERVRVQANLAELLDFERDLDESIGRALRDVGVSSDEAEAVVGRHVQAAWHRLEDDWQRARDQAEDCPLCAAPLECPPTLPM
jgi:hypothetical protein